MYKQIYILRINNNKSNNNNTKKRKKPKTHRGSFVWRGFYKGGRGTWKMLFVLFSLNVYSILDLIKENLYNGNNNN